MNARQIVLPFRLNRNHRPQASNLDLIGRSYMDDYVKVTVVGLCPEDDQRVLVRRRPGNVTPMFSWLMRSIFAEEDKKKKRAA